MPGGVQSWGISRDGINPAIPFDPGEYREPGGNSSRRFQEEPLTNILFSPVTKTYRADKSYPDAWQYGGGGQGNLGRVEAAPIPLHGRLCMLNITLPPLAAVFFKSEGGPE